MKKLNPTEEKFFLIQTKHPVWSSYVCFLHLVRGQKYTMEQVVDLFDEFVDKSDYTTKSSKIGAIEYAYGQTEEGSKHLF